MKDLGKENNPTIEKEKKDLKHNQIKKPKSKQEFLFFDGSSEEQSSEFLYIEQIMEQLENGSIKFSEPFPSSQTIPEGPSNPNYGYSMSNPVILDGFNGVYKYLNRLRTTDGKKLRWNREGSSVPIGKYGPSDIYAGFLEDGTHYKSILVNMYGSENPKVAPTDFIYVENKE